MRIGNCNPELCDLQGKTMSAMETGFFEKDIAFAESVFYGKPAGVAKEEL